MGFSADGSQAKDIFLKIDGIKGESQFEGHRDELTVEAFSWGGVSLPTTATGGPAGAARICSVNLTVRLDRAYPKLLQAASAGTHLAGATLSVLKGSEIPFAYLILDFDDVVVRATGQVVNFTATRVAVRYQQQERDGTPGEVTQFSFEEDSGG